jgi:hypothetical protein
VKVNPRDTIPPVRHRRFTVASALSLLIFVAIIVLWARSYFAGDDLIWETAPQAASEGSICEAVTGKGRFFVIRDGTGMTSNAIQDHFRHFAQPPEEVGPVGAGIFARMGFAVSWARGTSSGPAYTLDDAGNAVPSTEPADEEATTDKDHPVPTFFPPRDPNGPAQPRASVLGFTLGFPLWLPASIFGLLSIPAIRALRRRVRPARQPGTCAGCGYDLRGSTDRCPECGMAFFTPDSGPTGRWPM